MSRIYVEEFIKILFMYMSFHLIVFMYMSCQWISTANVLVLGFR